MTLRSPHINVLKYVPSHDKEIDVTRSKTLSRAYTKIITQRKENLVSALLHLPLLFIHILHCPKARLLRSNESHEEAVVASGHRHHHKAILSCPSPSRCILRPSLAPSSPSSAVTRQEAGAFFPSLCRAHPRVQRRFQSLQ